MRRRLFNCACGFARSARPSSPFSSFGGEGWGEEALCSHSPGLLMTKQKHFPLAIATILLSLVATSAANKLNVLVITGGHGFDKTPFFKMFEDNSGITLTQAEHSKTNATVYDRTDLLDYDVVVLYDMPKEITDSQKE